MKRKIQGKKQKNQGKTSRRLKWAAIVVSLAFLLLHARIRHVVVPPELVGTWRTDAAPYADRSLEIGYDDVTIETGPGQIYTGFIRDVQAAPGKSGTLYTISYTVEDTVNQISFNYDKYGDKTIRLKNQDQIVWTRDDKD